MANVAVPAAGTRARGWLRANRLARREALLFYALIAPWLVSLAVFTVGPVISSLYLSFTKYDIVNPATWVGLANYRQLFTADPLFYQSLRVTAIWVVVGVPLRLVIALFFAVLLNQRVPAVGFFRTVYYLPSVVSGVAVSLLWVWVLQPQFGLLNYFLHLAHLPGPQWLSSPTWALPGFIVMSLWTVGATMIISWRACRASRRLFYEAAKIDGQAAAPVFAVTVPDHAGDPLQPGDRHDQLLPGVHPGLRHDQRRAEQRHPLLRALSLSRGLPAQPDGVRLGDGLEPLPDRPGADAARLPLLRTLGALRRRGERAMSSVTTSTALGPARSRRLARLGAHRAAIAGRAVAFLVLALGVITMLIPFYWMLVTSLKDPGESSLPAPVDPTPIRWANYSEALTALPFGQWYLNTVIVTVSSAAGQVIAAPVVGLAFARLRARARRAVHRAGAGHRLLLPEQVTMVPVFLVLSTSAGSTPGCR